jgi:hypothetical protein
LAHRRVEALPLQVDGVHRRVDLECQRRVAIAPASDSRQQPALRERRQHGDAQPLFAAGCSGRCGLHAVVQLRKRALHAAQQRLTRGVEHDAAPAALEQVEAQLLLEHADLLAHRRCASGAARRRRRADSPFRRRRET